MKKQLLVGTIASLALVAASCGDDDDDTAEYVARLEQTADDTPVTTDEHGDLIAEVERFLRENPST